MPKTRAINETLASAVVLASLALTGCSAGNQSADPAPSASEAPSASASPSDSSNSDSASAESVVKTQPSADDSQKRADKIMNQFLKSYDRTDFKEFSDGTPHQLIKDWYLKPDGKTFVIVVDNKADRLRWLALDFLERTFYENDLAKTTVLNENDWGSTVEISDIR